MTDSYFVRDGDAIVPTEHCGGPWDPAFSGGSAVAGMIAHEARAALGADGLLLARFTVDMMRPVPMAPLQLDTQILVDRRRLKLVDCALSAEGTPCVRASAQFLAPTDVDHGLAVPELSRMPDPEQCARIDPGTGHAFRQTVEVRAARDWAPPESGIIAASWFRVSLALFPGEPLTAELAAAMVADLGFGTTVASTKGLGYINSDFTAYFGREPHGEWIGQDGTLRMVGRGTALGSVVLHDLDGPFGTVTAVGVAQERFVGKR